MATKTKAVENGSVHEPKNRISELFGDTSKMTSYDLARLQIRVVGISPLLCHNPAGSMKAAQKSAGTRATKEIPDAVTEAEAGVYRDEDGDFAFPNGALYAAIVTAAEILKLKIGSGRMAPSVSGVLIGGLSADYKTELVKLIDPKTGKPLTKYAVDSRRVVIPSSGSSIVRSRPKFDPWCVVFDLLIDSGDPRLCAVLSEFGPLLLKAAGLRVGLGDNRPFVRKTGGKGKQSFGGPFGRFEAQIVE